MENTNQRAEQHARAEHPDAFVKVNQEHDDSSSTEEIFSALDDLADVVTNMEQKPGMKREAARLDRVGDRLVAALIRKLSLKSAQIEELTLELNHLREAWGDRLQTVSSEHMR